MKNWTYFPVIGVIIGEFLIYYGKIYQGVEIHIISIISIILVIILSNLPLDIKNTLQSMTLLPMLQIISISTSKLFMNIYWHNILVNGIMLVQIYMIIKNQHIYKKSITVLSILLYNPLSFRRVYIYKSTIILIITMTIIIGQYANIIPDIQSYSAEVTYIIGEFASIFLIIILSILFLISGTKYWDKNVSNILDIYINPLSLIFVAIMIYKIIIAI